MREPGPATVPQRAGSCHCLTFAPSYVHMNRRLNVYTSINTASMEMKDMSWRGERIVGLDAPAAAPVNIALIGASGRIGRRLLELVATRNGASRLRIVALANSRGWLIARDGLRAEHAGERLAAAAGAPGSGFADALTRLPRPLVLVDCSASAEIAGRYPQWLAAGIDVVTPNKFGPSADRPLALAIAAAQVASGAVLRDAATVG